MMNRGYTISSPKCGRKALLPGRHPHHRGKKLRLQASAGKHTLMAFFDWQGLVYQHFVHQDIRINRWVLPESAAKMREPIAKKRPHLKKEWVLHRNNPRLHVAKEVTPFLQKHNIEVMVYPPYIQDLRPCDFWLFPRLKTALHGSRFKKDLELLNAVHKQRYLGCV